MPHKILSAALAIIIVIASASAPVAMAAAGGPPAADAPANDARANDARAVAGQQADAGNAALCADKLYTLGLFRGVGSNADGTPDFALDRPTTRVEAVCVFVKLIGKEAAALKGSWKTPFTDVPEWARQHVGYAYVSGLVGGTGATVFGSNDAVPATEFLSLILSALGYLPGIDFGTGEAWELTDKLGITDGAYGAGYILTRGDITSISFGALKTKHKYLDVTLCSMLVSESVITASAAGAVGLGMPAAKTVLAIPDGSDLENAIFCLINAERENNGLSPLLWNGKLSEIARAHSVDMYRKDYFSHFDPDGVNPADRLASRGISYKYVGENIARGFRTPEAVVAAWMGSATHRNAILSEKSTHMGVGVYNNHWTVDFLG